MNGESLVMSIPQLADALSISANLCYSLARADRLPVPVIKIGQKRMVGSRRAVLTLLGGENKLVRDPGGGDRNG